MNVLSVCFSSFPALDSEIYTVRFLIEATRSLGSETISLPCLEHSENQAYFLETLDCQCARIASSLILWHTSHQVARSISFLAPAV